MGSEDDRSLRINWYLNTFMRCKMGLAPLERLCQVYFGSSDGVIKKAKEKLLVLSDFMPYLSSSGFF